MRRIVLLLVLFALVSCGEGLALTLQEDFPVLGTFHWGPFRVRPFLQLKDTGYDSNVFLEDGTPTSDFTSTAEAGLRMFSLFRDRGVIQIEEILDYVWYEHNDTLSHFNNAFQARGAYYMRRGYAFAELRTLSLRERPSTEIDYRIRRRERMLGTGWRFVWPHTSLQFRLGRDTFEYDPGVEAGQNIPLALNRVETAITVTGSRRILPKTDFLMEWEGRRIDFTGEFGAINDSRSRRLSAGFLFDPSAFIKGTIKIGVEDLEPDSSQREGFRGPVGDGTIIYRLTGLTSLQLRGRRQVGFTTAENNIYYTDQTYGATLTQALADRVAAEIGIDREVVDFPVDTSACITALCNPNDPAQFAQGHRLDRLRSYFVGTSYRFSPLTRVGLRMGVWERNSDPPFEFLNRHRLTAQVIYAYNF